MPIAPEKTPVPVPVTEAPPVRVAAAPVTPNTPANNGNSAGAVMMTASVSSNALREEGGRLRIVQKEPRASALAAVEAEPTDRSGRSSAARVASAYEELGQGRGGSGLLVGNR
jgi:hypothetical protein